jgi:hypothetical protein
MYRVCIVRSYNVGAHTTSISVEDKGRRAVVVDGRKAVFTDREAQKIPYQSHSERILVTWFLWSQSDQEVISSTRRHK